MSLQNESEWEKEWSKKKNEILGLFNAGQHHLLTQNGSVNLTSSQQREEGEYNCRDAEKAVNRTEEFFLSVLSNREKEIAEEVEKMKEGLMTDNNGSTTCNSRCHDSGKETALDEVLLLMKK